MASRAATKAAAREQRIAHQRAEAEVSARRRRRRILLGLVAGAAAIVAVVLVLASSGGDDAPAPGPGQGAANAAATLSLLDGIPQQGMWLGRPGAPLTLVEYADMQCPACGAYSDQAFPAIVKDYVRTGKLRIELRLQSFLGPDSVTAASAVAAASMQDRAWTFVDLFYRNQGTENSGYVTDDFLAGLADSIPGLDAARMLRDARGAQARTIVEQGAAAFSAAGFEGTPSFQIGATGGTLRPLEVTSFEPEQFRAAIDAQLAAIR